MSSSASQPKGKTLIIVHDVLGTLFDLSAPIAEIKKLFASQLGPDPVVADRYAELIVMDWYHAGQRDFSFLSLNSAYTPIGTVFKSCLPRVLLQAGLVPPSSSDQSSSKPVSAEELKQTRLDLSSSRQGGGGDKAVEAFASVTEEVMASLQTLTPRPGMTEAFRQAHRASPEHGGLASIRLWGATNGSLSLAEKLFENASVPTINSTGDAGGAAVNAGLWSCDEAEVAKPDPRVYGAVKKRVLAEAGLEGASENEYILFFVASHSWDVDAAKRAGFHTLWMTYEEFSPASGIYLEPDLRANDLVEGARLIREWVANH
ncbi:hypothetical protein BCV69DRAFT_276629 [Microstroma glucosiphilum]|uniref:HAD-like protein n=1 Tax=Pseudomicrostroma glucosiphilum TaxID=1684307 RepID=A0A316UBW5_9BASI|nr:hypothetical protein BCV69DRAFT_276629 [Pseudomicrostroma glucosiphilum]PWN21893.1 hypothetical protein BCV69DRAFT_276629 [Pseudomicrostroma glucosiphilum]